MKSAYCIILFVTVSLASVSFETAAKRGGRFGKGIRGSATKTYDEKTLSVTQLTACLKRQEAIESSSLTMHQSEKKVSSHNATVNELNRKLETLMQAINGTNTSSLTSQYQIDAYNSKIDNYNSRLAERNSIVERYEQQFSAYNAEVQQHYTLVSQFDLQCAGKQYYEDDMITSLANIQVAP